MKNTLTAVAAVVVVAVGGAAVAADIGLRGTESTTTLDQSDRVVVDGTPALTADIVALRVENKYHPLPWIGKNIGTVTCPGPLPAVPRAEITCTGSNGGGTVKIPVMTLRADATSITWTFSR